MSSSDNSLSFDSSAVIAGLAPGLLTKCKQENKEYLECKAKNQNPEECLKESINCRKCAFNLANDYLNSQCNKSFTTFVECLRKREYEYKDCYKPRLEFEQCAASNLGVEFKAPVNPQI
ncbi:hypothetical protein ABK040_004372 [Willaertia magna]